MKEMLSSAITWLHDKWYIAIAVALIVIIGLVYLFIALSKASRSIREDSAVNKARRRDSENARKKQEEMERLKVQDALIAEYEEAQQEETKEPSLEGQIDQEVPENTQEIAEKGVKDTEENMKKENVKPESAEAEVKDSKAIYRVIYDKENKEWMVKKDGAARVIRRVRTKAEALEIATQFAENQDLSLSVQKKDGKFQKKSNYSKMVAAEKEEKKPEEKKTEKKPVADKKPAEKKPSTEKKPAAKRSASKK